MTYNALKDRLDSGGVVILDGGIGTELQRRGAPMDPAAWCGPATLHNDRVLTEIHADYIAAGAEVITANTFASSRIMLSPAGYGEQVEEINRRAVTAALSARDLSPASRDVVVAGSLSHMTPITQGSAAVNAESLPSETEMSAAFSELAGILERSGCELIILEMMYHPRRIGLALEAALSTGLPVWFGLSARRGRDGRVISFNQTEDISLDEICRMIPGDRVDAAGVMHTPSDLVGTALERVREHYSGPLMAYPDSGYFEMPEWRFIDIIEPEAFESYCRTWIKGGVQILGGCCGLTIEHIEAAVRARDIQAA